MPEPTQEQLLSAFKAAADSGDEAAARVFAAELQKMAQRPPTQAPALDPRTPDYGNEVFGNPLSGGPQTTLDRFRRGTQDVIDRGVQLSLNAGEKIGALEPGIADSATQQINKERAGYDARRVKDAPDGKPGIDFARIGGGAAPLAPLGLIVPAGGAGYGAALVNGAVQGGISGALQYDPTNSLAGTAKNTAVGTAAGGLLGVIGKGIGDAAGKAGGYLIGKIKGVGAQLSGKTSPQSILQKVPEIADQQLPQSARQDLIEEAAAQLKSSGNLDAEALGRKANLLANLGDKGQVTKSMVTRSPQDWAVERNLSKLTGPDERLAQIGGELTDVYRANDAALADKLRGFSQGRPQGSQESLGQAGMEGIEKVSKETQKQVGDLYDIVRSTRGNDLASDARKLYSTLDDLGDSTYAEKLVGSVRNKLKRFGMIDSTGALTNKTLTVTQAEELRKFVNRLPNDYGKSDIISAIDQDVLGGLGDDAFGAARKAASDRFDLLGNPATQRAVNTMGELQQGKTAQNFIQQQVVNSSEQDLDALLKTLASKPDSIQALRAGVLQHLEERAINPNSGQFSGANLNKALNQFGDRKLNALFGVDEASRLKSLARAGLDATYQPPYSAVNSSNTTPTVLSLTRKARAVPGVPLLVTDEAEKIAARSGYQRQLADALAARSGSVPESDTARQIAIALSRASTPAVAPALDQTIQSRRRPVDKR